MKWTFVSCLGLVAVAYAAPSANAGDCSADHPEKFEVTASPSTSKRDLQRRGCSDPNALVLTLNGGQIKDSHNRVGYLASNSQFQFDDAPQPGAVATSGFSVCSNGSLALEGSTVFYRCLSGDFFNLYGHNDAGQCEPIRMVAMPCDSSSNAAAPAVSQIADGQPQAPTAVGAPVTQIADGQPQAPAATDSSGGSGSSASQISDGQVKAPAPSGQAGNSPSGGEASSPGKTRPAVDGSAGSGETQPASEGSDGAGETQPASEGSGASETQPTGEGSDGAGETQPASEGSDGAGEPQNAVPSGSLMSPPVTNVAVGSPHASNASETSAAASSAAAKPAAGGSAAGGSAAEGGSNASPPAPSKGPLNSGGFKALPGATTALLIALFSIIAL